MQFALETIKFSHDLLFMSLFELEFPITLGISEKCLPLIGRVLNLCSERNKGRNNELMYFPLPTFSQELWETRKLSILYWCAFQHIFSLFPGLPFVLEVVLFVPLRRIRADFGEL